MARPQRNTVDYFPHLIGDGKKMFFIEQKYGNDGYATWFKILELLASTENHYLNLNNETDIMFTAAKCRVSEETLLSIITDLSKFGVIDAELWDSKVLWCQIFIDSIQDAYSKRSNNCMSLEGLRGHLLGLGVLKGYVKPQSKEKETILEETKEKKKVFTPPTLDEVKLFFQEKKFPGSLAIRAFEHYDIAGWKDTNGNKVKNWKQKMLSVWMKDENKNYNGKNNSGSSTQLAALRVESKPFGSFKLSPPNGAGNS
jgi:hypothetical protein